MNHPWMLAALLELFNSVEKWLAGLGAFIFGAFVVGLFAQLLALSLSKQKIPSVLLSIIRLLGGIVSAWLVMLLVGGVGFSIGPGGKIGPGTGKGNESAREGGSSKQSKGTGVVGGVDPLLLTETLEVEVLGPDALKPLQGKSGYDSRKIYRANLADGKKLVTLDELKKRIAPEGETAAYRRIILRIYGDSPNSDKPQVTDLQNWAQGFLLKDGKGKIEVRLIEMDEIAPAVSEGR